MRIKELNIKNFKVFRSLNITLPEKEGIVIIYGTGGSGKTSLWQAFQWILGIDHISFGTIESRRALLNIEVANALEPLETASIEGYLVVEIKDETYRVSRSSEITKQVDNRFKYKTTKSVVEKYNEKNKKWSKTRKKIDAAFSYWFLGFDSSIPNLDSIITGYAGLGTISDATFLSERLFDRLSRKVSKKTTSPDLFSLRNEHDRVKVQLMEIDDRIDSIDEELQSYKDRLDELKMSAMPYKFMDSDVISLIPSMNQEITITRERICDLEKTHIQFTKNKAVLRNRYDQIEKRILEEQYIQSGTYKEALLYATELKKWLSETLKNKKEEAKQEVYELFRKYADATDLPAHYRNLEECLQFVDKSTEMQIIISMGIELSCRYLYEANMWNGNEIGLEAEKIPLVIDGFISHLSQDRLEKMSRYFTKMNRQLILFCHCKDAQYFEELSIAEYELVTETYTSAQIIQR